MRIEKTIHDGNSRLVLFFSGWAATPVQFRHLSAGDADCWIVYDYRSLDFPEIPEHYTEIHLIAWSMGVWVASQVVPESRLTTATAINGTPYPGHDEWGIPVNIFQGTLERLDEANWARFCRRMCGSRTLAVRYEELTDRRVEELKEELSFLNEQMKLCGSNELFVWNKAFVSLSDHVVPSENQLCYWKRAGVRTIELDAPHHPFHLWSTWEEIWKE